MFAINPMPSTGTVTSSTQRLPAKVEASSPFAPAHWTCPSCASNNPVSSQSCNTLDCTQTLTSACPLLDQRDHPVPDIRFPATWLCSTCHSSHGLFSILVLSPSCPCGTPTLQAVYDQFGDLLLFWPDDEQVRDLSDGGKVEEAARRLLMVGGDEWLDEMPVIRMIEEVEVTRDAMNMDMIPSEIPVMADVAA